MQLDLLPTLPKYLTSYGKILLAWCWAQNRFPLNFYFYDFLIFSFCTYSFKLHNMINLNKYLQYLEVEFVDMVADKNIEFFIPIGMKAIFHIFSFQQSSRSYLTNNIGVRQIEGAVSIWQVSGRLYMDLKSSMEKRFIS